MKPITPSPLHQHTTYQGLKEGGIMSDITVQEVMTFIITLGSLLGAVGVIMKVVSKPMTEIKKQIEDLNKTVGSLSDKVEHLDQGMITLKKSFEEKLDKLEDRQHKQSEDMHMSLIVYQYLLECNTDTSEHGRKIREQFNEYVLQAASSN